jgi:acetyl-CoA C-acetyltransferase
MPGAPAVGAVRTPGGRRGGKLAPVHPVDLAAAMLDGLIKRSKGH